MLSKFYNALKQLHKEKRYFSTYYYGTELYENLDLTNDEDLYNAIKQVPLLDLGNITIDNMYDGKYYYDRNILSRQIGKYLFKSKYNKNNKKNILIINDFFIMLKSVRDGFDENGQDLIDAILKSEPEKTLKDYSLEGYKDTYLVIYQIDNWRKIIETSIEALIKSVIVPEKRQNQLKF